LATTSLPRPDVSRLELQATVRCFEADITPEVIRLNKDSLLSTANGVFQGFRSLELAVSTTSGTFLLPATFVDEWKTSQAIRLRHLDLRRCHADFRNL